MKNYPRNRSARAWSTFWLPPLPFPSSLKIVSPYNLKMDVSNFSPSSIIGTVVNPGDRLAPAHCTAEVCEHGDGELVPGLEPVRDTLGLKWVVIFAENDRLTPTWRISLAAHCSYLEISPAVADSGQRSLRRKVMPPRYFTCIKLLKT